MTSREMILRALEANTYTYRNYDIRIGVQSLPRLSLGRHAGHTTAIIDFINDNQTKLFGILGLYRKEYKNTYSCFRNTFNLDYDNVHNNRFVGIRFDYLIVENALGNIRVNNNLTYELERIQSKCRPTTRLIALGN